MAITYPVRAVRYLIAASLLGWSHAQPGDMLTGMLKPVETETREIRSLDGLWNFRLSPANDPLLGFRQKWFEGPLSQSGPVIDMPVPSSFNDITQDKDIRDHLGLVWYDRTFFVPSRWNDSRTNDVYDVAVGTRVWLRFGSVHYAAKVYINGIIAMSHEIGHLPFEADISNLLTYGAENRVTVVCDNTLLQDTIPQGGFVELASENGPSYMQTYSFDFFNYAGIHRPVVLYTTPRIYISDVSIDTNFNRDIGIIDYTIKYSGLEDNDTEVSCLIEVYDQSGAFILNTMAGPDLSGTISIPQAKLWWPFLMDKNPGYMYTLKIILSTQYEENIDVYRQLVGIRTISWTNTTLLINNREVYLRGFGRHEDSDIRGKGLDLALLAKDYNLIKWIGANSYRTSHYPYAEEVMDMADKIGIMIINECPSVDTENYNSKLLMKHKMSLSELIRRDKNRPGVIMWSVANEPRTQFMASDEYFGAIVEHVKSLDTSRPVTIALSRGVTEDKVGKHLDIISFNRYNGWYSNTGRTDMITDQVIKEARSWHKKYQKPVLMSEYGADTVEGLHLEPEFVWSEEYQVEMMSKHFKAFDKLRDEGFFIGEFIWNFADFKTAQTITRVGGNKKGIFTRQRQPKAAAHHLRARYHLLAEQIEGKRLESDLFKYLISGPNIKNNEL